MKTDKEISAEIAELQACKKYVPKQNGFGDDNHAKLDAAILVLEKKLTEEEASNRFLGADGDPEPEDSAFDLDACARDAAKWLHDEKDAKAPHLDWEHLKPGNRKVAKNPALAAPYGAKSAQVKGDPYKKVAKSVFKKNKNTKSKRK